MKKALFISQGFSRFPETKSLIESAATKDYKIVICSGHFSQYEKYIGEVDPIFYGEVPFCTFMADQFNINLRQNSLNWITEISDKFSLRKVNMCTLEDLITSEETKKNVLNKLYVEPADEESFEGDVIKSFPKIHPSTEVLYSPPIKWEVKFRFVAIQHIFLTRTCYYMYDKENYDNFKNVSCLLGDCSPETFIKKILDNFSIAPSVIDVGFCRNLKSWGVVKTRPVWSTRMLGCTPGMFLKGLELATESQAT